MKNSYNFFFLILFFIFSFCLCSFIVSAEASNNFEKAFQETAWAYYMRGTSIQYNTAKGNTVWFSPEEATSKNLNYLVCAAFAKNIYNDLIGNDGLRVSFYTSDFIDYAKKYKGIRKEVIAYGSKLEDSKSKKIDFKITYYNNGKQDGNPDVIELVNNELKTEESKYKNNLLNHLKIGDILTYTGHTIVIYDFEYNSDGTKKDAYILESTHGSSGSNNLSYSISTKIPLIHDTIARQKGNDETTKQYMEIGDGNPHLLYHNSNKNTETGITEGSLHYAKLSETNDWGGFFGTDDLRYLKDTSELSIIRFITEDNNTKDYNVNFSFVQNYNDDKNQPIEYDKTISLSSKVKDRIEYSKLYVTKTANVSSISSVRTGDKIKYTIEIKNNSNNTYGKLNVEENIDNKVLYNENEGFQILYNDDAKTEFTNYTFDFNDSSKLKWTINSLESGEGIRISYSVSVKDNYYGEKIISSGKLNNISTSTIVNRIQDYTPNKDKFASAYNELKNSYSGLTLINEIYKKVYGEDYLNLNNFEITKLVKNNNLASISGRTASLELYNPNDSKDFYQPFYNSVLNNYWNTLTLKSFVDKGDNICKSDGNHNDCYYITRTSSNYTLPLLYNYDMKTWNYNEKNDTQSNWTLYSRADTIYEADFQTGDILIYKNSNDSAYSDKNGGLKPITYEDGTYAFIYIEGLGFVGNNYSNSQEERNDFNYKYYFNSSITANRNDIQELLFKNVDSYGSNSTSIFSKEFANNQTLFGKDNYVILRPAIGFDLVPMNLEVKYNSVDCYYEKVADKYICNKDNITNQDISVTITSNEDMWYVQSNKDESGTNWVFKNTKVVSKNFGSNATEKITLSDYGNRQKTISIEVEGIDKVSPVLSVGYSTTQLTNKNVIVTITSTEEIQENEKYNSLKSAGWNLSTNKKILTKTFTENSKQVETIKVNDLAGNESNEIVVNVNNIDKINPTVQVHKDIEEMTMSDVTVAVTANEPIQDINEGWTLSTDTKKVLTKKFVKNGEETINICDLAGNCVPQKISVTNISENKMIYKVNYSTTLLTNKNVVVTITFEEEIESVGNGWVLSDDHKTLTKTFSQNTEEAVKISNKKGNSVTEKIVISNIDKNIPEYSLKYSETKLTNKDVIVTLTANEPIQGIEGWTLSNDNKVLTKIFGQNAEVTIKLKDLAGNETEDIKVSIANIDKVKPDIDVFYSSASALNESITVKITSNEEIQELDGWEISADKKMLTRTFTQNYEEELTIYDLAGNGSTAKVSIHNIKENYVLPGSDSNDDIKNPTTGGTIPVVMVIVIGLIGILILDYLNKNNKILKV